MKLYVAGPMKGRPEYNYPEFHRVSTELREVGYEVVSPAEPPRVEGWLWEDYLKRDIPMMLSCDGVAMLDDWHSSKGAALEVSIANALKMPTMLATVWIVRAEFLTKRGVSL